VQAALRALHRAGICHNDLSKQQNWLRGRDGRAYLMDFQLASCFSRRTRLFRVLAYEDLRHLLKHKHRYLIEEFTPAEWRMRARKTGLTALWMLTAKPAYELIMHRVFGYVDREGGGTQLANDSPRIAACLKQHPQVRDAAVVQFYDRGARHNLYAFVEAGPDVSEHALRDFVTRKLADVAPPAHVHVSEVLPRAASGDIRTEILQLVASNQLDEIDSLLTNDAERATVAGLVAQRRNLHDRF
jgi:hypothetical protein